MPLTLYGKPTMDLAFARLRLDWLPDQGSASTLARRSPC
jgi:hypothetical protein